MFAMKRDKTSGRKTKRWALACALQLLILAPAQADLTSATIQALRMSGTITGFLRPGFFVELDEIPVEGFVRVSLYLDDHFVLDPSGVRMVGRRTRRRFTLGDSVHVTIARVDVPGRECDLALDPMPRRHRRHHSGRN